MYLNPMRTLDQLATVFCADAVEHAGGVEGAHDVARPFLSFQQPAQQNGENFVRIDEAAVFGDGANAVGVAIGGKSRRGILPLTTVSCNRLVRLRWVRD